MSDLLILTEGGEGIGLGHITRCSAVAGWFEKEGLNCRMVIDWYGDIPNPTNFEEASWVANREVTGVFAKQFHAVLIDSYKAPAEVYREIKTGGGRLFVMDDYRRLNNYGADLIINPNIYGDTIDYGSESAGGNKYVILREAFRENTARYTLRDTISSILVTIGGSDSRSLLPLLAGILEESTCEVAFVCGSDKAARQMEERFSDRPGFRFYGFTNPGQMNELMLNCDVAISACGQTLHELAYLGIPTIGIRVGDDQLMNQKAYTDTGFLSTEINWDSRELKSLLLAELVEMENPGKRAGKSKTGMSIIDGKGIERIAQLILHDG